MPDTDTPSPGTLYGVGVGPGDPDHLTLKAVNALQQVDVVFAAASTKHDHSLAHRIAAPHLRSHVPIVRLGFPMTRDHDALHTAWRANAETVIHELDRGRHAAFLTLGDPMLYSTFAYLLRELRTLRPELPVVVVPGITSMQAAAARTETVLASWNESLLVLSGVDDVEELGRRLQTTENAVILKAYRRFSQIRELLKRHGAAARTRVVSRLGLDDERIHLDIDEAPAHPNYLTTLLVTGLKDKRRSTPATPDPDAEDV